MAATPSSPYPPTVRDALEAAALRVQPAASGARLWERVLRASDRRRLGDDFARAWARHGTVGMWRQVRGVPAGRAVVDVARVLDLLDEATHAWLLRELGEIHDDPDEAVARAAAGTALVLVERPRAAYWQGQLVPVAWDEHSAGWDFFWELARHAKADQPIDHTNFPAARDVSVVTKRKHRLVREPGFPPDLAARMRPAGRYTLRLDVPPEQIRLFALTVTESVQERAG